MDKLALFFILSLLTYQLDAQFLERSNLYFSGQVSFGNYTGGDARLNFGYDEKYSLHVGYAAYWRKPPSQPDDYSPGLVGLITFGLYPSDRIYGLKIMGGRIFKLGKTQPRRINVNAGIGFTQIQKADDWRLQSTLLFIGPNYSHQKHTHRVMSIIVNPEIEFTLSRSFGFTISPMVQISGPGTYAGVGFGWIVGSLWPKEEEIVN